MEKIVMRDETLKMVKKLAREENRIPMAKIIKSRKERKPKHKKRFIEELC